MADCGICLDALRSPVAIPCGHVHCERCLRAHINSGTDALRSGCPTCRKPFHIASPDFAFVPQKYHDFILPSVRKIYMDIPSVTAMAREIECLTRRLEEFSKENMGLRACCADYKRSLENMVSEKDAAVDQEEEARLELANLGKKYDILKKKYREVLSRDNASHATPRQSFSRRSSQDFDAFHDILPKVEESPVSLYDLNPNLSRPKRSLPRSRPSNGMRCEIEPVSQSIKRQRTHRYLDVGPSNQVQVSFKDEDPDDE